MSFTKHGVGSGNMGSVWLCTYEHALRWCVYVLARAYDRILVRNLLPMMGRYKAPSLHTAVKMEARIVTGLGSPGSQ